jgi:hypothetical protein
MKKSFTILILGAFLYFLPGWNGARAQEPLDFIAYTYNPVLTHGPGTYDATWCFIPFALWHDEIFYLYYTGNEGICLATSSDGYTFNKFSGNPIFTPSASGFDSYMVSDQRLLETGTGWVMYYNANNISAAGPGPYIGRATSGSLTGPWARSVDPVLTVGSTGEWDAGFILPNNVIPLDTGGYIMFYSASTSFSTGYWEIGMATSPDGVIWKKYNDPSTTLPPYTESDPVLKVGATGDWDEGAAWECTVIFKHGYYEMYYSGGGPSTDGIGYAWSYDGITWEKWAGNPVYSTQEDPYGVSSGGVVEVPSLLIYNETVFMYYDYGPPIATIGLATSPVWVGTDNRRITDYGLRITNYPNPVIHSTKFHYTIDKPGQVTIQIFDSFGRPVDEPVNDYQQKGDHHFSWNAETFPAGIYYYRLQSGEKTGSGKMVKL